jgi:hypothetical protein
VGAEAVERAAENADALAAHEPMMLPGEHTQMSGRAGQRNKDAVGGCVVLLPKTRFSASRSPWNRASAARVTVYCRLRADCHCRDAQAGRRRVNSTWQHADAIGTE